MIQGLSLDLFRYCELHSNHIPDYLIDLERITHRSTLAPQMLSGRLQGRLLSLLSRIKRPLTIVEIGTFTGYSALCLAEGLDHEGTLHTFEVSDQYDEIIDQLKEQVSLTQRIVFHKEDALSYLPGSGWAIDLAFVDGSKKQYPEYLRVLTPLMKKGSMLISDNVLWYGKVLDAEKDTETTVLDAYNKSLAESEEWDVVMLPVRDGLSIAIKKV
jgi:caffeoyl-CoA O-methyltransferase